MVKKLEDTRKTTQANTTTCPESDCQGELKVLACSISFGHGQINLSPYKPGYLKTHPYQHVIKKLLEDKDIQNCAGFTSSSFQLHDECA